MFRLPVTPFIMLLVLVVAVPLLVAWIAGRLTLAPVLFGAGIVIITVSLTRHRT